MADGTRARLAVLIDAENAGPSTIAAVMAKTAQFGDPVVRGAFKNWGRSAIGVWGRTLAEHGIEQVEHPHHTSGKNSADIALTIAAIDLLYSGTVDGFCLVSSDSDFTSLAQRIRGAGLKVYGFGRRGTPRAFVGACDQFLVVEDLVASSVPVSIPVPATATPPPVAGQPAAAVPARRRGAGSLRAVSALVAGLRAAVLAVSDPFTGWATISAVVAYVEGQTTIRPPEYGYATLQEMINTLGREFELKRCGPKTQRVLSVCDRARPVVAVPPAPSGRTPKVSRAELRANEPLVTRIEAVLKTAGANKDGWSDFDRVASALRASGVNPGDYGYRKPSDLVVATGLFEVRQVGSTRQQRMQVRDRRHPSSALDRLPVPLWPGDQGAIEKIVPLRAPMSRAELQADPMLGDRLTKAVWQTVGAAWCDISVVAEALATPPVLDLAAYGCTSLVDLVSRSGLFDLDK